MDGVGLNTGTRGSSVTFGTGAGGVTDTDGVTPNTGPPKTFLLVFPKAEIGAPNTDGVDAELTAEQTSFPKTDSLGLGIVGKDVAAIGLP